MIANQRVIIMNLALSEMSYSFLQIVSAVLAMYKIKSTFLLFFVATFGLVTRCIMLHLIIDRAMVICLHLKYPVYFTTKRVKLLSFLLWLVSALLSLGFIVLAEFNLSYMKVNVIIIYLYLVIDSTIVISSIASYTYLFFVTVKSENNLRGNIRKNTKCILSKYRIPCLITASYIVFNFTGMVLVVTVFLRRRPDRPLLIEYSISVCLVIIGTISDCIIYVIFQKDLRQYLCNMLTGRHYRERYRKALMNANKHRDIIC